MAGKEVQDETYDCKALAPVYLGFTVLLYMQTCQDSAAGISHLVDAQYHPRQNQGSNQHVLILICRLRNWKGKDCHGLS